MLNRTANDAYTLALFDDPRPWWNEAPERTDKFYRDYLKRYRK
jgi:hypothetical protein